MITKRIKAFQEDVSMLLHVIILMLAWLIKQDTGELIWEELE